MTPMRLATIKEILDAFARSGAEELEVADGTLRLRVLRRRVAAASPAPIATAVEPLSAAPTEAPLPAETPAAAGILVMAAMHGVFHRAPTPDAEPFVTLASRIAR